MFTEQQEKWLKRTEELFLRFGIKATSMDDVARELGISKKTLYQFVENKNDLVMKMVALYIHQEKEQSACWARDAPNAIEEMLSVLKQIQFDAHRMRANVLFDMQKYHHGAWLLIRDHHREFLHQTIFQNLERGAQEGIYRQQFNAHLLARIFVTSSFSITDENWFPRPPYELGPVFREFLLHFLYGIVSEKGRQILEEKLS